MDKKIFVFTGLIACGKGAAVKYLMNKYDADVFRYSTILRNVLDRLYLPQSRENFQKLNPMLLSLFGQDLLSRVIAQDLLKSGKEFIVLDGARRLADISEQRKMPGFKLISIEVDQKIRYQRLVSRAENPGDAEKTWEQFQKEDIGPTEVDIPALMKEADVKVDNNGTLEEFYKQLDNLIL